MTGRLLVSTDCPTCGGPLDFSEGSNAIRCGHCSSNLLVTGRKQLLSYWIKPKIAAEAARARVARIHRNGKIGRSRLYFVPYYRMTGQDFGWQRATAPPKQLVSSETQGTESIFEPGDWGRPHYGGGISTVDLVASVIDGALELWNSLSDKDPPPPPPPKKTAKKAASAEPFVYKPAYRQEIELLDRHVEKNFLAANLQAIAPYSLGVRSSVLRLSLFARSELEELGNIVAVNIPPGEALARGLKAESTGVLYRQIVAEVLSLIYFPFQIVEVGAGEKTSLVIVDGITGSVVSRDAPSTLLASLQKSFEGEARVIGFRPLTCPNCGWDMPFTQDDTVFLCSSCDRAWQIAGSKLQPIEYDVAVVPSKSGKRREHYLPFWVVAGAPPVSAPSRYFIPAFRYRQLQHLQMISTRWSESQPLFKVGGQREKDMPGCYYDSGDAAKLARFIYAGVVAEGPEKFDPAVMLNVQRMRLVWFPFEEQGNFLLDPFFGINLYKNLLI